MKNIFAVIMFVFICLVANAQEVHGYSNDIATELSSEGFIVKEIGYILDTDTIEAVLKTPTHYDEELTRLVILRTMKNYEDIRLIQPWKKWLSKYDGSTATYQLPNGKRLVIFIGYLSSYDYCLVFMYEGEGLTDE